MLRRKDGFDGQRLMVLPESVINDMAGDPLFAALHITDIGYYPKAHYHFMERNQPINQHIFTYCVDGEGWFTINGKTHQVTQDQFFILPAGVPHRYGANENNPWTIYWMHFKGTLSSSFVKGLTQPNDIKPNASSRINERISLFEEIFHILEMGYTRNNLLYASSALFHFLGTLRFLQQYRNVVQHGNCEDDIIAQSIHYMKENINKKLSHDALARHAGYSPSHFSALFVKRTGYSPSRYFNYLKIQEACQLLSFTDLKISQICYKIGIEDSYYFSRLFSKTMGMSPRQYKLLRKG